MSSGQLSALQSGFMGASQLRKERLFALSCFDISHWESEPNWTISDDIVDRFLSECEAILDRRHYNRFTGEAGEGWIENAMHRGIIANHLLSWHVSSTLGYRTKVERLSGGLDNFDVRILKDGLPYCDIEIKRFASSRSIDTEVESHIATCESHSEADYTVLFLYFPLGEEERSARVNDYLVGYVYSYSHNVEFFMQDENYICPVPSPVDPDEDDIVPLEKTVNVLRHEVGIERRA